MGVIVFAALLMGAAGCDSITGSSDPAAEAGEVALSMDVTPVEAQLGESVTQVELTLTPWGQGNAVDETLTPEDGQVSATITGLAPGQWDVHVAVFAEDEALLAEGSADGVSIRPGEMTELSFTLQIWIDPETGALELQVNWSFQERIYDSSVEDCIVFDPDELELHETDGGTWRILYNDGDLILISFGSGEEAEDEAREAMRVIEAYQLTHFCFVARPDPGLTYFLTHGVAPRGDIGDEDCSVFPPASDLSTDEISEGNWRIVGGGSSWFSGFDDEEEAERAIGLIEKYQFNEVCYVGRPDPSMQYFKAP